MDPHARKAALLNEVRLIGCGAATLVLAGDGDLRWLGEFFEPSLGTQGLAACRATVSAGVDADRYKKLEHELTRYEMRRYDCFTLDGNFDTFPGCQTAQGELLISLDRFDLMLRVGAAKDMFELVASSTNAKLRLGLMRVVREIATVRALRAGGVPLHGSACARQGVGFGFLGHKTAGKTTSLIHWLRSEETRFLANDRFFLFRHRGGWLMRGMPTIVKLRPDTLQLFDGLAARASEHPYHWGSSLVEVHAGVNRLSLYPEAATFTQGQFLRILERPAVPAAPLRMLLFPERDDNLNSVEYTPLSSSDATSRLAANLLSPGATLTTAEVFDPEPDREIAREPILSACREVAESGGCFAYHQGIRTLSQMAAPPGRSRAA